MTTAGAIWGIGIGFLILLVGFSRIATRIATALEKLAENVKETEGR